MLYIVSCFFSNPFLDHSPFYTAISLLGQDRFQIFPNAWLVYYPSTIQVFAVGIQQTLQQHLAPLDRAIVAQINPQNVNGWLGSDAWTWVRQHMN